MITHGELFAGIGGFALGFERCGIETIWSVEIEPNCNRVLARHFPDTERFIDIHDCGKHNLKPANLITFGSPCQDLSIAGRRNGLKGKRSNLFYEAIRICDELKPDIAVWENVPGAFSSNFGRDFLAVLVAFHEIGAVDVAWRTLDAQYFGVPQRRRRIFLVADFRERRAAEILFESECLLRNFKTHQKRSSAETVNCIEANSLGAKWGSNQWWNNSFYIIDKYGIRRYLPIEYERLFGFPDNWTAGESDSARYRMLGNAVAVPVVEWIGNRMIKLL